MSLRWFLWTLGSPSQLLMAMTLAGIVLLCIGWRRSGRILALTGGTGLLLFGLLPGALLLARPLETRFPIPRLPTDIDGIVMLAGAERPYATARFGQPQLNEFATRYLTTLTLATRYPGARIVHTGSGRSDPDVGIVGGETRIASRLLEGAGIPASRLVFEQRSRDTFTNALYTRDLVHPRPGETWVLVTSAIHIPRAVACFRAVGWRVIPYPAGYLASGAWWDAGGSRPGRNLAMLDVAVHEWLGLAYYRLIGRTQELFPAPEARDHGSKPTS